MGNRGRRSIGRGVVMAGCALVMSVGAARAQQAPADSLKERVRTLEERIEALELKLAEQEALLQGRLRAAMDAEEGAAESPRAPFAFSGEVDGDPRQRQTSGIYSRPFVARFGRGTAVGGYVDLELETDLETDAVTFDQHRFIPFFFAQITDRIHFATELEFEHGAEEIALEFAALDVTFTDWLSVRGGIVLSPLGKFNLVHDSPVNDLTARPLVDRQIIPTTLSEAGLGVFGTVYPSELSVLTYEAYVVNGFDEGILENAAFTAPGGDVFFLPRLREGRGSLESDNNADKAFVGRLAYSPFLGLEVGGSLHTGKYAPSDPDRRAELGLAGDERLTIFAVDAIFNRGPFEVLGEFARASMDAPTGFATAQQGYYVQGNYHFGHGLVPLFENSVFTAVARWGSVDFDADTDGGSHRRLTFGLNWRPVEETVFKVDLLHDWTVGHGSTEAGEARRKVFFSLASYF